jgi:hypothetical protein
MVIEPDNVELSAVMRTQLEYFKWISKEALKIDLSDQEVVAALLLTCNRMFVDYQPIAEALTASICTVKQLGVGGLDDYINQYNNRG